MGISVLQSTSPLSGAVPLGVGATPATAGASLLAARGDHRHLLDDTGWLTPTLQNGWILYDGTYANAAVYRKVAGVVFLRGLLKNGTVGATILTLPAGFRPSIRMLFAAETNPNVNCRIDVDPTGTVNGSGESAGWVSLANVVFVADG